MEIRVYALQKVKKFHSQMSIAFICAYEMYFVFDLIIYKRYRVFDLQEEMLACDTDQFR